jgi:hypothetical protein
MSDEKTCPKCAETVKSAAVVCRFCGHNFASQRLAPPPTPAPAQVIMIDDYRPKPPIGPIDVTFIGFPHRTPEGADHALSYTITVPDGDFYGAIQAMKEAGGIWIPRSDETGAFWFLPWPCAAVRIRHSA